LVHGFKKNGKFRPTGNGKKLSSSDLGISKHNPTLLDIEKEKTRHDTLTSNGLVNIINDRLNKKGFKDFPYSQNNFREIEEKPNGDVSFKILTQSHDEETKGELEAIGFKFSNVRDIIDTRHADVHGNIKGHREK